MSPYAGPRPSRAKGGVKRCGKCRTCGATVSGERWYCGLCLARREDGRAR